MASLTNFPPGQMVNGAPPQMMPPSSSAAGQMPPGMGQMTPGMGQMPPGMGQMTPGMVQKMPPSSSAAGQMPPGPPGMMAPQNNHMPPPPGSMNGVPLGAAPPGGMMMPPTGQQMHPGFGSTPQSMGPPPGGPPGGMMPPTGHQMHPGLGNGPQSSMPGQMGPPPGGPPSTGPPGGMMPPVSQQMHPGFSSTPQSSMAGQMPPPPSSMAGGPPGPTPPAPGGMPPVSMPGGPPGGMMPPVSQQMHPGFGSAPQSSMAGHMPPTPSSMGGGPPGAGPPGGMMPPPPGGPPGGMMPPMGQQMHPGPMPGGPPGGPGGMPPPPGGPPGMMPPTGHQMHPGFGGTPQSPMPGHMPPPPGSMPGGPPGAAPPGPPRQKLDPNLMPSAVQVLEDDRKTRTGLFQTGFPQAEAPPLVTTEFYSEDQGNSSPSFMRSTLYCAPANNDLLKTSTIPFGISISPLTQQSPREQPVPVVDLGEMGPVRCQRCKAYMCPYMEFQDGGRRFKCPFCKASSDVPQEYFAHLDHQGRRTDIYQRPELILGSYEFVATKAYCKNGVPPKEPAFIFMLDVSYNAVRSGLVNLFCQNIKYLLQYLPTELNMEKSAMRIGFATYDQTVHFYNLKNSLDQPQMMIVADVQEVFVPMADGFLVTLDEAENAIDCLLQEIPAMFAETRITEILLGPVIQAGMDALAVSDRAGKLFLFHSCLPVLEAPGKLKNRDDRKLLGSDKEKTILAPQSDFYSKLAVECVNNGCAVDMFLFPNAYIDVATIGSLCNVTGGQIYKYQYFEADRDGERFLADLRRDIERPIVFDAMMRVRTSTGIRPTGFHGSFHMSNTSDMEFGAVDADKAIDVEIRHDDKLEDESAYIQSALLFTSCSGQRRLRIHNLCLATANNHAQLYRLADQDTVVNFLAKIALEMQREKSPKDVREHLSGRCAQMLATYRERCSEQAPAGQLILPECLKLLPLYVNCVLKHDAFSGSSDMATDDRSWMMQLVPSLKVTESVRFFYPRMLPVLDAPPDDLPNQVRCSYENLKSEGVFLMENGVIMFLWIGLGAPAVWVQDVFGVQAVTLVDTEKQILPEKDTDSSRSLRRLIERLNAERPRRMKLYIVRQQDHLEPWMKKFLVEDRAAGQSASYVDFLCHIHREIRSILS